MPALKTPSINLLSDRKRKYSAQVAFFTRLKVMTGVAGVIYAMVLVGILVIALISSNTLNRLNERISDEEMQVKAFQKQEASYTLLASKVGLVSEHLDKEAELKEALQVVYDLMIPGMEMSNVSFGQNKKSVNLQATAQDIFTFTAFLTSIQSAVANSSFAGGSISNIKRDGMGVYHFDCEFLFKDAQSKPAAAKTPANETPEEF